MSVLEVIASSQRDARGVRGVLLPCRVSLQALKPRGPDHAGTHTAPRDPLSRARRAGGRTLPIGTALHCGKFPSKFGSRLRFEPSTPQ